MPALHPSPKILEAFAFGKLTDTVASDTVIQHLETCVDCREKVTGMSGDSFLERMRAARQRSNVPANAKEKAQPRSADKFADLPPELRDNQQYEVLRELGRGGMGVVYLAKNRLMDRLEVLKVLSTSMLSRSSALDRFLREIRAAAALSHDNVVKAHSAMQFGDTLVFAMEYVEGDDLAKVVKAQGPLAVANACYYARQVALGLQHAHERGMVHRDIKPHNLILARIGKKHLVKILDFGLAKATSEKKVQTGLTQFGAMLGTPDYMAPEQSLDAATADIRADIYSLGCTLYYLLTGAPPFGAGSLLALLQAHQTTTAKPLNLVRPEVPVALSAIVATMMAKEPGKRYQKPAEVAQALMPFFMKPAARGGGADAGQLMVAEPVTKTETAKPVVTPRPNTPRAAATVVADDKEDQFSFAAEALVQNPLAKKTKAKTKSQKRIDSRVLAGLAVGAGVLFLWLILWGAGVLRVQTKDGTIVLENLPPGAEVSVDGGAVTVKAADGKSFEVRVAARKKHRLEIRKDGFKAFVDEIELDNGGRKSIIVRLIPNKVAPPGEPSPPPTGADRSAAEWVLSLGGSVVIRVPGEEKKIGVGENLPAGSFELVRIDLVNKPVSDAGLMHLKGLTELKHLDLGHTGVSDAGLAHLAGLTKLAYLSFWQNPKVTDAGLIHLKGLTELKHLYLDGTEVSDAGLAHLEGLTSLESLWLWRTKLSDAGLAYIKKMTNLTALSLDSTNVSDAGLIHLKGLTKLTQLRLAATKVSDAGLIHIKELTNLWYLSLGATKVTDAGLAHVKELTKLTVVGLNNTNVSDAGLEYLKGLTNLSKLWLYGNMRITDAGLVHLQGLSNLQLLSLASTKVSDAGLPYVKNMTNLTVLGLENTSVSNAGMVQLKGLTNLSKLWLNDTQIGDDGLRALYGLFRLRELYLTHTKVTAEGIAALRKALPECRIIADVSPDIQLPKAPIDEKKFKPRSARVRGPWKITGNELSQTGQVWGARISFGNKEWKDYDFTVDGQMVDGDCGFALFFRDPGVGLDYLYQQDGTSRPKAHMIFFVGGSGNSHHYLEQGINGNSQLIFNKQLGPAERLKKNTWYSARVSVRGDRVKCFLDGSELCDVRTKAPPAGRVGLMNWTPFRFRNIKVTDPDGRVLFEGLPDVDKAGTGEKPDTAVIDPLPTGSVWKGKRTYQKGAYAVNTVAYELHVRERTGAKFKGHVFDNGAGRNRAEVEGEINGVAVTWRERRDRGDVMTMAGILRGDMIRLTFRGKYPGGATNEGDGELKLDVPPPNSAKLTILNQTGKDATIYWLNQGKPVFQVKLLSGKSHLIFSYFGHRFRAVIEGRADTPEFEVPHNDATWRLETPALGDPLFNGKNLDGWQQVNSQRTQWSANNGILVGKGLGPTGPRNVGTLVTTRNDYQNFHLRVKTMMCEGQACNVAFRLGDNLDNFTKGLWADGYLLHLGGTKENPAVKKPIGSISDSRGRTHGQPQDVGIQPGRWYVIELIAEANHFKVFIDDKQILDCEDEGSSFSRGRIALQCRPFTVVKFEQIEIKELP